MDLWRYNTTQVYGLFYTTARARTIVTAQKNAKHIQNQHGKIKWKTPFADTRVTKIISQNS